VINASYRYAREVVGAPLSGFGQIDVSGQWPLGGGWYGVARYNYSTKDKRVIETLGGLEYNGGCWATRTVIQRSATQFRDSNTALFFQLELKDFSRIGSNPLDLLRRAVPGYDANIVTAGPDAGDSTQDLRP
jgi:LPS-assembly protein